MNTGYLIAFALVLAALFLQYDWLLFAALAVFLVAAFLGLKKNTSPQRLPPGLAEPTQLRSPSRFYSSRGLPAAPGMPGAPYLPKKKKKIRRPIIIIQQPPHAEGVTHGILDEAIKHSFPPFMTPQHKAHAKHEEEERMELIKLLREQRDEMSKLRKKIKAGKQGLEFEDDEGYDKW